MPAEPLADLLDAQPWPAVTLSDSLSIVRSSRLLTNICSHAGGRNAHARGDEPAAQRVFSSRATTARIASRPSRARGPARWCPRPAAAGADDGAVEPVALEHQPRVLEALGAADRAAGRRARPGRRSARANSSSSAGRSVSGSSACARRGAARPGASTRRSAARRDRSRPASRSPSSGSAMHSARNTRSAAAPAVERRRPRRRSSRPRRRRRAGAGAAAGAAPDEQRRRSRPRSAPAAPRPGA